jgi:hypothetical protein
MIETPTHIVPTGNIAVPTDRQRRNVEQSYIENLASSILQRGLLHPIILKKADNSLVVGECRLLAWRQLEALPDEASDIDFKAGIPSRYTDEMRPDELKATELEENIQRRDLAWQDAAVAFLGYYETKGEIHMAEQEEEEDKVEYSFAMMSGDLNCSDRHCRRMVQVGRAVRDGDGEVSKCDSARAAGALLERRAKRIAQNELVTFGEVQKKAEKPLPSISIDDLDLGLDKVTPDEMEEPEVSYEVKLANFVEWHESYGGPRFNFVHCDFPFGKSLHTSDLYKTEAKDLRFEDEEEMYWDLCQSLVYAQDTALSKSCHIMFWFPMDKYTATVELFKTHGFWVDPYPLVWMKSDKMGLVPDPTRGPRRIYETALIMSLGDRKIIKPTVNAAHYPSESKDKEHVSQKSQTMLEDFFRMFIESESVVLDPTCGSGTALAAAIKLGAAKVVGLDNNESCVEIADANCRNAYTLKIKE